MSLAAEVAASRCMRSHGVPNWPDPITIGGKKYFGFLDSSGVHTNTPVYRAAHKYCVTKYLHFADTRTPAEKAESNAQAMKWSQCMRSHGASDFPDPDGAGAINLPTQNYIYTPKVAKAQADCKPLFTGNFVTVTPVG
jgi:hypothetical protein